MKGDVAIFIAFLMAYIAVSVKLFNLVYQASNVVVDEEFHLLQGKHYCLGNFDYWNGKITTFPGLYLVSTAVFGWFKECSTYALRSVSLFASIINCCLIFIIRKSVTGTQDDRYVLLESMSLATLPPLYFFSTLYYTDVLSVTTVLLMFALSTVGWHYLGGVTAVLAVLMRQTNIVWVACIFGNQFINLAIDVAQTGEKRSAIKRRSYTMKDFLKTVEALLLNPSISLKVLRQSKELLLYTFSIVGFIAFLLYNKSIVIGDKTAHVAKLHIPQIFYFSLFFAVFSSSYTLGTLLRVKQFIFKARYLTAFCFAVFTGVVYHNTIAHPYLLADNRHYTFYIWSRFYGKWFFARYLPIPLYYAVLVLIVWMLYSNTGKQNIGFALLWTVATVISIALQQLIEVRYFILPFLILRLMQTNVYTTKTLLFLELIGNLAINAITFYIFLNKTFYWKDYSLPQRIIW